ncbi:MAG: hypothetical protein QNK05_11340 [Myxococcota bacterium]|nr:hypothetical protein [Myxococcota bacterium]
MLLSEGSKLLICHRRLFVEDQLRFFFGVVEAYAEGVAKVSGYTWTRDPTHGFQSKSDRRTKLVSVASGSLIVYELSQDVDVAQVRIEQTGGHTVIATDGAGFQMDLSERL